MINSLFSGPMNVTSLREVCTRESILHREERVGDMSNFGLKALNWFQWDNTRQPLVSIMGCGLLWGVRPTLAVVRQSKVLESTMNRMRIRFENSDGATGG